MELWGIIARTKQRENSKITIFIEENVRKSGKVRQKPLQTVATVPPEDLEHIKELVEHIRSEMEVNRDSILFPAPTLAKMVIPSRKRSIGDENPLPVNISKLREASWIVSGIHEVYGSMYDKTGFYRMFSHCPVSRSVMKGIVMARLGPAVSVPPPRCWSATLGLRYPWKRVIG